jgi:CheY-like chemotaxis protein
MQMTQQKTILVVEDDTSIGEIIALTLSEETSFQVHLASSAQEALKILRKVVPAIFLLDYQLPSMTGLQLYDYLQTLPEFAQIPTIMMSANLPWRELEKRNILGLQKPFEIDELIEVVERTAS